MNTLTYEKLRERKSHVTSHFPYNTYLCSIPMDFSQVPEHWHNEVEIIIIKKGRGIISVDMIQKNVYCGDIILIRPGQIHAISQYAHDLMEYENIIFKTNLLYTPSGDFCSNDYFQSYFELEYELPWYINADMPCHSQLTSCILAIDTLCDARPKYYELSVKGHLFQFFYILFSNYPTPLHSQRNKSLDKIKEIIRYIEANYQKPITLHSLAVHMGFSDSHLMKFLHQNMHTTFTKYLNDYRLTIASRLLLNTDDSVLEISGKTGFNNLSYFNRLFKKQFQMTPSKYRKTDIS